MKKFIPILIVGVLLISGLGAVGAPESNSKQVSLSFSNISTIEEGGHLLLDIDGTNSVMMLENQYILPTRTETFTFPFGTKIKKVTCRLDNFQEKKLSKSIMPTPKIAMASQGIVKSEDKQTKLGTDTFPRNWYNFDIGCGINGKERNIIVNVEVFPVKYYPEEKMIEWAKNAEIKIEYELPSQPVVFDDVYSFVILAPSEFSDELAPLVTHKIGRNISTIFVSLNDIYTGVHFPVQGGDNQEKIKYFIKNAIENWATTSVLLVGSSAKFPTRTTYVYYESHDDDERFVSDLYYADIYNETNDFCSWDSNNNEKYAEFNQNGKYDDVDLYPDVYLGRLACTSGSQVTTCVNKIKTYENNVAYSQDWFTNFVVSGGDTWVPDHGEETGVDEGELLNQNAIDTMDGFLADKIWTTNGRLRKVFPPYGKGELTNAINTGCGFLHWSGHGNTNIWGTHPHNGTEWTWIPTPTPPGFYSNSDVSALANGDKLPIVVVGGCLCGRYNSDSSCFAWSFLSNSGGGGIATVGATAGLYSALGKQTTQAYGGKIELNMFRAYKTYGAITFGEMWSKAISKYLDTQTMRYLPQYAAHYKTIEEWQPFGDPTLAIGEESQPPVKPDAPEGTASGQINTEYTYTASTTDPDGDKLEYFFDWGNGDTSGWIGPYHSGSTASASYTWTTKGDYQVRVKARDDHFVQSGWSDPLHITMPKSYRPFNSLILEILEKLMERFPFLEQLFETMPIISALLGL